MHERTWRLAGAEEDPRLPCMDVELWFLVCGCLRREDVPCGLLPALDEAMRIRPWVPAVVDGRVVVPEGGTLCLSNPNLQPLTLTLGSYPYS